MKSIKRWIALPLGALIFLIGAILFPLPIPLGIPLMVIGLAVLALNPLMLRAFRRWRGRHPEASRRIGAVVPHLPAFLRRIAHRTTPPVRKAPGAPPTVQA